jgi:hypothetical protein
MRLRAWRETMPGHVRLVVCAACGHTAPLPIHELIRRFGELYPIDSALPHLCCSKCQAAKIRIKLARLCDPACRHWRR